MRTKNKHSLITGIFTIIGMALIIFPNIVFFWAIGVLIMIWAPGMANFILEKE